MSTTGTHGFDPQLAELFDEAFERAGVDPAAPGTNMLQSARRSLRFMLNSEWSTFGVNTWSIQEGSQTLQQGMADFYLPSGAVDIWDVILRRDDRDTEMYLISRDEYFTLTDKTKQGRPSRLWLDKSSKRPRAFFWECGANATDQIRFNYLRQMQDAANDNTPLKANLDMPIAAFDSCAWGLAFRLAQKFNQPRVEQCRVMYGGSNYPDRFGGSIEHMRQTLRDRGDIDLYPAYEPRATRR